MGTFFSEGRVGGSVKLVWKLLLCHYPFVTKILCNKVVINKESKKTATSRLRNLRVVGGNVLELVSCSCRKTQKMTTKNNRAISQETACILRNLSTP